MATTSFFRDYLWRKIQTPGSNALDSLGRACTSTADPIGRLLFATATPTTATAVTVGQRYQNASGVLLEVTVAGTTAVGEPAAPGYGQTVTSGTATFKQITTS